MKENTGDKYGDRDLMEEEVVSRLLDLAGPRPSAPRVIKEAAHEAWRANLGSYAERRRAAARASTGLGRHGWSLAAAAVLLVTTGLALWWTSRSVAVSASQVATVEALFGGETLAAVEHATLAAGDAVFAGATIETRSGMRASLRLAGGESVRLDAGTRLRLDSANALTLHEGAVYFDTGRHASAATAGRLRVETPLGVAHDIGTQFELRLAAGGLRLQVREGEVRLDTGGEVHTAPAGTRVTVRADGTFEKSGVTSHGTPWDWVLGVPAPFELEGSTAHAFLEWVARETGWHVRYADADLAREAARIVVHGSVEGLRPDEAPGLVLPGSLLDFHVTDGTIFVGRGEGYTAPDGAASSG